MNPKRAGLWFLSHVALHRERERDIYIYVCIQDSKM